MATASDAPQLTTRRTGERARPDEIPARRILVVDDSPPMRAVLRTMLRTDRSTSWTIVEASNGVEALDVISSQPPFDVVLLDVQMPGMDGFTVCRRLRERHPRVSVVFLTAEGDRGSFDRGRASGGDSYLVKPFSPAALKAALHVLTSLKRCPQDGRAA
jgi:CheY-like chemotaxis protein